jgi:UDP-N-acetyl-D-glucosamine dehydrogenase
MDSHPLTTAFLSEQDCVVIVTDHSRYDWDWVVLHATLVVDTRNATRKIREGRERIVRA